MFMGILEHIASSVRLGLSFTYKDIIIVCVNVRDVNWGQSCFASETTAEVVKGPNQLSV